MSSCIPTAARGVSAAAAAESCASSAAVTHKLRRNVCLSLSKSKPTPRPFSYQLQGVHSGLMRNVITKAQLNNVGSDGSSSADIPPSNQEIKNGKPSAPTNSASASEDSISQFISQVASLVKLVDSRDIVELQLKQHDCELSIRKREAIPQTSPPPVVMMHTPSPPTASAPSAPPAASPPPTPQPAKSSVPPLKSPMAGTFYRSPAPTAPPFVKVGDKVNKGQVLCIIEAMKLMNEIEADQSGTIVEVLAEDGKPVSVDTPLFAIQP